MNTHEIGDRAEARVLAKLLERYVAVLLPFGNGRRYDMVVECTDGSFKTVQAKNGRLRDGVVKFKAASFGPRAPKRGYQGIDYFGVFCPDNDTVYLVPVADVPVGEAGLRIAPTKDNRKQGVHWAKDYVI